MVLIKPKDRNGSSPNFLVKLRACLRDKARSQGATEEVDARKSGCPQKKHGMLGPKAGMHDGLEEGQVSVNFVIGKL